MAKTGDFNEVIVNCSFFNIEDNDNDLPVEDTEEKLLPSCLFYNGDSANKLKKDGDVIEFYYRKNEKLYHYKLTIDQIGSPEDYQVQQPFANAFNHCITEWKKFLRVPTINNMLT